MRIVLIDVDNTRFPNLALMKIAKWHKQEGNIVHWWTPFERYDAVGWPSTTGRPSGGGRWNNR